MLKLLLYGLDEGSVRDIYHLHISIYIKTLPKGENRLGGAYKSNFAFRRIKHDSQDSPDIWSDSA